MGLFLNHLSGIIDSILHDLYLFHMFNLTSNTLMNFRRFIEQILFGVEYLHGKGIIHRDIKGANILVNDVGVAKLADFGCSKKLAGLTTTSLEDSLRNIMGSVPWMAPEVIKQSGHGRSADIWSVGATVVEMGTMQLYLFIKCPE